MPQNGGPSARSSLLPPSGHQNQALCSFPSPTLQLRNAVAASAVGGSGDKFLLLEAYLFHFQRIIFSFLVLRKSSLHVHPMCDETQGARGKFSMREGREHLHRNISRCCLAALHPQLHALSILQAWACCFQEALWDWGLPCSQEIRQGREGARVVQKEHWLSKLSFFQQLLLMTF